MAPFMSGKDLSSLRSRLHRQHRTMSTGGDDDCDGRDDISDMLPSCFTCENNEITYI
jgi:hypothetical protein